MDELNCEIVEVIMMGGLEVLDYIILGHLCYSQPILLHYAFFDFVGGRDEMGVLVWRSIGGLHVGRFAAWICALPGYLRTCQSLSSHSLVDGNWRTRLTTTSPSGSLHNVQPSVEPLFAKRYPEAKLKALVVFAAATNPSGWFAVTAVELYSCVLDANGPLALVCNAPSANVKFGNELYPGKIVRRYSVVE